MAWQETEAQCVQHIKNIVGAEIEVIENGGSDSTAPDIVLKKNGKNLFNIEVKEASSQAGQFVIFEDENGKYFFSTKNKCRSEVCQPIIDYINNNKKEFKSISTAGTDVNCDKSLMYQRVKRYYLDEKDSKYFITKSINNFIIFPTEDLDKYFDISCVARRKKSGSQNVSPYIEDCVKDKVSAYLVEKGFALNQFSFCRDGKYYKVVFGDGVIHNLGGKKFETDCFNLNFSKQKPGEPHNEYKITVLSHTNNPNIIFTLNLKTVIPETQENMLISELN